MNKHKRKIVTSYNTLSNKTYFNIQRNLLKNIKYIAYIDSIIYKYYLKFVYGLEFKDENPMHN